MQAGLTPSEQGLPSLGQSAGYLSFKTEPTYSAKETKNATESLLDPVLAQAIFTAGIYILTVLGVSRSAYSSYSTIKN